MALSKDDIRIAAERLDQAEKTRKQIRQISLDHPDITIEDSYAIQKAGIAMKVAQGRLVKGHKIGLTSKAMQSALNVDEPRPRPGARSRTGGAGGIVHSPDRNPQR
jgi:2-oxo-hept-3-ene-1,7-dioate hydratase